MREAFMLMEDMSGDWDIESADGKKGVILVVLDKLDGYAAM